MRTWREQIEAKARIIQSQMDAARQLSSKFDGDIELASAPYFAMLERLYVEEFPFAALLDSSDLVARFDGPALSGIAHPVGLVSSVFMQLRGEVRNIAKSIAGLSNMRGATWPSHLDPNLAGLAKGSLVVGISVPSANDLVKGGQASLEGFNDGVLSTVRMAVKSLPVIARHIGNEKVDESIVDFFPDPAIRDSVMVSARRLSPTGRRGVESVTFYAAEDGGISQPLTARSRIVLGQALSKPIKSRGIGEFRGLVREIDLDARRFEIRGVNDGQSAIRCIYSQEYDSVAREYLDSVVVVKGGYEVAPNETPRLVIAENVRIFKRRPEQPSVWKDDDHNN